jgi:hypothetical protein
VKILKKTSPPPQKKRAPSPLKIEKKKLKNNPNLKKLTKKNPKKNR